MKTIIDQLKEQLKKEARSLLPALGIKTGKETVIGLDLGLKGFRAVRVTGSIKEIPLKDILIKDMNALKDLATQMNIDPEKRICINFSGENIAIRRASVPIMPQEEIEEALRWELKDHVQFGIEKARIKFEILGEEETEDGSKKIDLIAIVYKEKDVEEKVRELKNLGLNIQGVFPTEFSLAGYVGHLNIVSPQEKIAVVDIGSARTTISIIENKRLCFVRDVAMGGDTITEAMTGVLVSDKGKIELSKEEAEKLKREQGISEDIKILSMMRPVLERLSNQIKQSLEYYEHRFKSDAVKKIILAGNGSKLKGLKEYLAKETSLEVMEIFPESACAMGLSLIRGSGLNLIPEKYKVEKKAALKRIFLRMISIVIAFLFLFSYGLLSIKSINLRNELKIYRSHWENIKDVKSIKDRTDLYGYAVSVVSHEDLHAGRIMKELSNLVPSFIMLDNLVIKDKEPNVRVSGIIMREEKLSEFMSNLENSAMFEKVKLVFSEKNEDYSSGVVDFEITCDLTR